MTLRQLTEDDSVAVADLMSLCFGDLWTSEDVENQFDLEGTEVFGIDDDDRLAAVVMLEPSILGRHIVSLATHPYYRRRGLATQLLTHVLRIGGNFSLHVQATDSVVRKLYRGFGFFDARTLPAYYPNTGESAVLMIRL